MHKMGQRPVSSYSVAHNPIINTDLQAEGQGRGILQNIWDGLWGRPPIADDQDEED